jgi:hypothetical protein
MLGCVACCLPATTAAAARRNLREQLAPLPAHAPRHAGHAARRVAHATAKHPSTPPLVIDLEHLKQRETISQAQFARYHNAYSAARNTLSHLSGQRHDELAAVLGNVEAIAADKGLIATRLPLLFLTIERNREWWSRDALLSYGERVSFPGSRLVWEYYTGQGIELQWLATFGEANGYFLAGSQNGPLRQVLEEAVALATSRAGGIAWEYMFQFDGGHPPWTSGLSQGTAIQAFSRAASRLHEPAFQKDAEAALGIFKTPPPAGVRVARTVNGAPAAEYLEYSFAPEERILNGYIQSLNGLYDFTKLTGSSVGLKLFEEGDAEARSQTPQYNTGAWSMYDQHSESDLGYHELLAEFLHDLCERTKGGEPLVEEAVSTTEGGGAGGTSPGGEAGTGEAGSGGASPAAKAKAASAAKAKAASAAKAKTASAAKVQVPGDQVYCETATDFYEDLHAAPVLKLLSHKLSGDSRAGVMFSLSKVATINLVIRRNGKIVWSNSATVEAGQPKLLWNTPKGGGTYQVSATAVDLAGNQGATSGEVKLTAKGK